MLKRFFKDSFIYTLSSIITGGITFFLLPFYTRVLNLTDFGILEYLTIFGSFIAVTVALEISQGVARYIPENLNNPIQKRLYASTSLWFTIIAYAVFLLIILIFKDFWAILLLDKVELSGLLMVATISFGINGLANLINNQLRWELKPKSSSIMSITTSVLSISLSIFFVFYLQMGVIGAFYGPISGGIVGVAVGLYLNNKSYAFVFDGKLLKQMLIFSLPLVFSSMGSVIANYIDRIAIKEMMTFKDVGIYGAGFRISSIAMLVMYGVQGAITPLIYAHYKKQDTPAELARIFRIFTAVALIIFAILSLFASQLISIFATSDYVKAAKIIPLIVLSILLFRMYIFAPGLGIRKNTIIIALISILSAALNITLNYFLIPYWGIMGSASATAFTALVSFAVYMAFSQHYYYVPHKWSNIIICSLCIITLVLTFNLCNFSSIYYLLIKFLILIAVIFSLFLFRIIKKEDFTALVRLRSKKMHF